MRKFKKIVCAVLRHSRLVTNCFGYKSCARCGEQLGDTLGGAGMVGYFQIGQTCRCLPCEKVFKSLNWVDRWLCPMAVWPSGEAEARRRAATDALMKAIKQDEDRWNRGA